MEQRTDEWFTARRSRLTASDVASVIGRNSKRNSIDIILEKLSLRSSFTGNAATEHGQKYEDEAIAIYEKKTGKTALRYGLIEHPTIQGVAGSPDAITQDGILLEVKVRLIRFAISAIVRTPGSITFSIVGITCRSPRLGRRTKVRGCDKIIIGSGKRTYLE